MRRVSAALIVVVLAAVPVFGAGPSSRGSAAGGSSPQFGDAVPGSPGYVMKRPMRRQLMRTPQHLLMMAYHKNVMNFGRFLYGAADQGATVPPLLARVAVSEIRRSVEEMEKYRVTALGGGELSPERQRMMDQHLVQVKTHLRELEGLVKQDQIDSAEVKKHLEPLLAGCRGAGCAPASREGRGARGDGGHGHGHEMMMERMLDKVESQDQELAALVRELEQAPPEKKLELVVETVVRMVRQRAEMTAEMERTHEEMMRHAPPMMPGMMPGMMRDSEGDQDEEEGADDGGMEQD